MERELNMTPPAEETLRAPAFDSWAVPVVGRTTGPLCRSGSCSPMRPTKNRQTRHVEAAALLRLVCVSRGTGPVFHMDDGVRGLRSQKRWALSAEPLSRGYFCCFCLFGVWVSFLFLV